MNLKDRLRMMRAAGVSRTISEAQGTAGTAAPGSAAPGVPGNATAEPRLTTIGGQLHGEEVPTPFGPAFRIDTCYPAEHLWGHYRLAEIFTVPPAGWQRTGRSPAFTPFDPRRVVFFDTETTGLSGGAGTRIFLAGLGFFEDDQFVVRQYFLRDYHEEPALLHALAADLSGRAGVVSFNGRSFDWPLLTTRYTFNRSSTPLTGTPHLDLLYPARRLWRARLERCNLGTLETAILGRERHGDVPGALIPGLYFDYLRTGDAAPLAPVIEHNRQDIVSLVTLAALLGHLAADPLGLGRALADAGPGLHGLDLLSLGRWLEEQDDPATGLRCYGEARALLSQGAEARRAALALAQAHRRRGEHGHAAAIWHELAETEGTLSLTPLVELAKYYEHRKRDPARARDLVLQAIELAGRRRSLGGWLKEDPELAALQHRLGRLDRKLSSLQEGGIERSARP